MFLPVSFLWVPIYIFEQDKEIELNQRLRTQISARQDLQMGELVCLKCWVGDRVKLSECVLYKEGSLTQLHMECEPRIAKYIVFFKGEAGNLNLH